MSDDVKPEQIAALAAACERAAQYIDCTIALDDHEAQCDAEALRAHARALRDGRVTVSEEAPPPPPTPKVRSCNMHTDCDAVDAQRRAAGLSPASHCRSEDCEDCFGY